MVFITNFHAQTIIRAINMMKVSNYPFDDLYKLNLAGVLSYNERTRSSAVKAFYEDSFLFVNFFMDKKLLGGKDKDWVFEVNEFPSYHTSSDCKNLKSGFTNFTFPPEISEKGEEEKERFRKWFKENLSLFKENKNRFFAKMSLKFNIKQLGPDDIEVDKKNSGFTYYVAFFSESERKEKMAELEVEIENLVNQGNQLKSGNGLESEIIKEFGNKTHLYKDEEVLRSDLSKNEKIKEEEFDTAFRVIKEWDDLKMDLKKRLAFYFMLKFNPKLEFDENMLIDLGFRKCRVCGND